MTPETPKSERQLSQTVDTNVVPGKASQNVLKLILKIPDLFHLGPIWSYLDAKFDIPWRRIENNTCVTHQLTYNLQTSLVYRADWWYIGDISVV